MGDGASSPHCELSIKHSFPVRRGRGILRAPVFLTGAERGEAVLRFARLRQLGATHHADRLGHVLGAVFCVRRARGRLVVHQRIGPDGPGPVHPLESCGRPLRLRRPGLRNRVGVHVSRRAGGVPPVGEQFHGTGCRRRADPQRTRLDRLGRNGRPSLHEYRPDSTNRAWHRGDGPSRHGGARAEAAGAGRGGLPTAVIAASARRWRTRCCPGARCRVAAWSCTRSACPP